MSANFANHSFADLSYDKLLFARMEMGIARHPIAMVVRPGVVEAVISKLDSVQDLAWGIPVYEDVNLSEPWKAFYSREALEEHLRRNECTQKG